MLELEERAAYICQFSQKKIGCLTEGDNGVDYNGTASKTWSGQECLRWDTPGIEQLDPAQANWSHNYCRNPGGVDNSPICFISLEEPDSCHIPKCQNRPVSNILVLNSYNLHKHPYCTR